MSGTAGRIPLKLGVLLGDHQLCVLRRMEDIRTNARVTVRTSSSSVRSRSFIAQKTSYWSVMGDVALMQVIYRIKAAPSRTSSGSEKCFKQPLITRHPAVFLSCLHICGRHSVHCYALWPVVPPLRLGTVLLTSEWIPYMSLTPAPSLATDHRPSPAPHWRAHPTSSVTAFYFQ